MKVYTKTGDTGETGLIGGDRVTKDDLRMEAIGTVDELNACIGICRAHSGTGGLGERLESIQRELFDAGAELGSLRDGRYYRQAFQPHHVEALERSIDEQTEALEPLRHFILPGGSELAAHLHHARTVCRRAERAILRLHHRDGVEALTLVYFNRLSDWLFVAARTANRLAERKDVIWTSEEV